MSRLSYEIERFNPYQRAGKPMSSQAGAKSFRIVGNDNYGSTRKPKDPAIGPDSHSSPRAQNLTPYVLPQHEGPLAQRANAGRECFTSYESLGREKAVKRGSRDANPQVAHTFLRRLSLRLPLIHHGEIGNETIRGMRFGNSPDSPLPIQKSEA